MPLRIVIESYDSLGAHPYGQQPVEDWEKKGGGGGGGVVQLQH